jgi:galactokinase
MNETISLFVPGRLCLFGEHSDWAGLQRVINADIVPGMAIVTGIEQGIYATAYKSGEFTVRSNAPELISWTDFECSMNIEELKKTAADSGYFSYVAGVASYIKEHFFVGGITVTITKMTLPVKSGLSSSAAICVLVARAFNQLYDLNMSTIGEMTAAYKGERRTSSRCGRLDQACAFGVSPVVMTFDGEEIDVKRLVVKERMHWVVANLNAEKDTIKILADLNRGYPFPRNDADVKLHTALGADNHSIVNRAIKFLKEGDAKALGALMSEAQTLFDTKVAPVSPQQLSSPKLHKVLEDEFIKTLTYGGKGVGSQGDGSVQFLARSEETQLRLVKYLNSTGLSAYPFAIPKRRQIRKAVIPAAGFGTRLYPATRALRKEFIPVIASDGLLKPIILILLEELYDSDIEEICVVVGSASEMESYRRAFQQPLPREHLSKLNAEAAQYEEKLLKIGNRMTFRIQPEKLGFAHAVFQSRDFCANEPALLLLADTIYRSKTEQTCCEQIIDAYETNVNRLSKISNLTSCCDEI